MPSAPLFAFYSVSADAVVMQKPHELFRPRFLPGSPHFPTISLNCASRFLCIIPFINYKIFARLRQRLRKILTDTLKY